MAKPVTEKSTKQEIFEAYQLALSELEAKSATKFDPIVQAEQKKASETISKVESTNVSSYQSMVNGLSKTLATISENLAIYESIKSAIELKKSELKEMFDIEKAAYTLSALINSQTELKEKFTLEMENKKAELDQLVKSANEEMKVLKEKTLAEVKKIDEDAKKARKQEEETYTYDTMRKRKIETDKFNDDLAVKTKDYEAKLKELVAREANIKQLESTIESLKADMAKSIDKATKEATDSANKSSQFKINMLEKTHEGEVALLNSKIETLTQALTDTKQANATLTTKLDEAYAKIESMAKATIDGAGSKDMIATLKTALSEKGTNSK